MSSSVFLLGVDPGLAHLGIAVVEVRASVLRPVYGTVVTTEKTAAKRGVYAADDNFRRMRELFAALDGVARRHNVAAVAHEAVSMPRNAAAAAKIASSVGVLAALCELRGMPTVQASPQAIKKAITGDGGASKNEVAEALCARLGIIASSTRNSRCKNPLPRAAFIDDSVSDGVLEHVWDALAAIVAAQSSDVVRALVSGARI